MKGLVRKRAKNRKKRLPPIMGGGGSYWDSLPVYKMGAGRKVDQFGYIDLFYSPTFIAFFLAVLEFINTS